MGMTEQGAGVGAPIRRGRMKRLDPAWYRGFSFIHWSMAIEARKTGWLNEQAHADFREVLLHTLCRYRLQCLVYCLMPDHAHMLWAGLAADSDQNAAASFFRRYWNARLSRCDRRLQKQAWDNVLREADRARDALGRAVFYIAENPVRAELVEKAEDWIFSGALSAGFPDLDWRMGDYQERMWLVYEHEVKRLGGDGTAAAVPLRGRMSCDGTAAAVPLR